jgi:hypothetical protein
MRSQSLPFLIFSDINIIYLYVFIYIMETKGDEHLHHPICEICQKEFKTTHELSVHIDKVHRSKDRSS